MVRRFALKVCAAMMIAACSPQESEASEFANKDFLELTGTQQKFWIDGAMSTLVHVAAANDEAEGQCVSDWYYSDKMAERNGLILASMEKYPDASPSSVLMALTVRACGEFRK